jgi:prepilin-type N-terminal cleavage/methylation domain-containing protein/prepilin-type processing-associated H-X9-DG protein
MHASVSSLAASFAVRGFRRSAFTLVELLVVIAVIAVLIGLLVPAVQRVRESSARTQCQNNLKQIGLAFQSHHTAHRFFPSGGFEWSSTPTYIGGAPAVGAQQEAGWGFQILPFIEAAEVWRGGNATTDDERIRVAMGTPNPTFFCPTRRAPQTLTFSFPGFFNNNSIEIALCDYGAANWENNGVVRQYQPLRINQITDGASSTLLVSEKRLNLRKLGSVQEDDDVGYASGFDNDTMRKTEEPPAPDYSAAEGDGDFRFGASHSGSFHAVFVDGSVRVITYTIDPQIFNWLGNVADGNVITGADLP